MLVWMSEASPARQAAVPPAVGDRDVERLGAGDPIRTGSTSTRSRPNRPTRWPQRHRPGRVTVDRELLFDPYADNRTTGSFILIDR
jgi:hypothetical protein